MRCILRDRCPNAGPIPTCSHGYWGPKLGTRVEIEAADGTLIPIYRVTDSDCDRCTFEGKGPNHGLTRPR